MKRKGISILLIFVLIFTFSIAGIAYGTTQDEIQSDLDANKAEQQQVSEDLAQVKADIEALQPDVDAISAEVDAAAAKVADIEAQIVARDRLWKNEKMVLTKDFALCTRMVL